MIEYYHFLAFCPGTLFEVSRLWREAVNITREEGGLFDVTKTTGLEDDAVDTKATTTVRWETVFEGVEIVFKARMGDV